MMKRICVSLVILCVSVGSSIRLGTAQDEPRATWFVSAFDIAANIQQSERVLNSIATLTIKNIGSGAGSGLTLRVNSKAKISSVNVNGASATFHTLGDRGNAQRLNITLPSSVAPGASFRLSVDYRLPIESNTGFESISALGTQFLPLSFWYPMLNTPFTVRGADTAPFKLKIEGGRTISSGLDKGSGNSGIYEQPLNGQPFFLQGDWEKSEGSGDAKGVFAFLPRGASADERKRAESMMSTAASARAFYAGLLGAAPDTPIRLVAVRRGAGFNDAGTMLIEWGAFRRAKLDAATAMLLAESVARLWIGAQTPIRGEGAGVLRDGLVRFLATLFLEKQFGAEAAEAERLRQRMAYAAVAKRDGPISRSTPLDDTYYSAVPNKGAMVWRLVDHRVGHDAFMNLLRSLVQANGNEVSQAALRSRLIEKGGNNLKVLLDQELDQPTDMNLMIGLPQQRGAESVVALRNLGTIDAVVAIVGTTDRGEQIKGETTVPAQNFGEVTFKTAAKLVRVEIDPEKFYPQLDYADDVAPRVRDIGDAYAEASRLFGAQDFGRAESVAREILNTAPRMQEARIILARALLGENKLDEAAKLFQAALDETLPTAASLAWTNVGLGEIALARGQLNEADKRFNDAVRADGEYASALAAHAGRIKAETSATSSPPVDESIKTFVNQLDRAITNGTKVELESKVVSGELIKFVNGITGTKPEVWQTRVLRTEQLDDTLATAYVANNSRVLGKEQSGTALLVLARTAGGWRLAGVELFEVR